MPDGESIRGQVRNYLAQTGIVAIVRLPETGPLLDILEAMYRGGLRCMEVTLNTPGALEAISEARSRFGAQAVIGVGTVLDAAEARRAVDAGAQFIVSPIVDPETAVFCRSVDVVVIPGAMTPTEVVTAWRAGADYVKIFPNDLLGPRFIRALRGPLPDVPLIPTGGVTLDDLDEYFAAGATAIGIGSSLLARNDRGEPDIGQIEQRAASWIARVRQARQSEA